jgi:hypothetical protein
MLCCLQLKRADLAIASREDLLNSRSPSAERGAPFFYGGFFQSFIIQVD